MGIDARDEKNRSGKEEPVKYLLPLALAASSVPGPSALEPAQPRVVQYEIDLMIDYDSETLAGRLRLEVENAGEEPVAEIPLLLYRLMRFTAASDADGRPLEIVQDVVSYEDVPYWQVNAARVTLAEPLEPGERTSIEVAWEGYLRGVTEVMGYVRDRIDPEFTIVRPDGHAYPEIGRPSLAERRAGGLPRFDYRARITVPTDGPDDVGPLTVANGGRLVGVVENEGGTTTWTYENVLPAWRMDFAVAPYGVLERGDSRVYWLPGDSAGAARILDALTATMALYRARFGPLAHDTPFAVIEIPDGFGSQADVTSILQTAAAFRDSARVREIYHEISHLWNVRPTDVSPRWNEGLATFLEYRTADELEGTATLDERVAFIAGWVLDLLEKRPELGDVRMADYGERGTTDLAYSVGMLMFDALHRTVGPETFDAIVGGFYRRFVESGASTDDFVAFADESTELDLRPLFDDWLYTTRWRERLAAGESIEEMAAGYRGSAPQARPASPE